MLIASSSIRANGLVRDIQKMEHFLEASKHFSAKQTMIALRRVFERRSKTQQGNILNKRLPINDAKASRSVLYDVLAQEYCMEKFAKLEGLKTLGARIDRSRFSGEHPLLLVLGSNGKIFDFFCNPTTYTDGVAFKSIATYEIILKKLLRSKQSDKFRKGLGLAHELFDVLDIEMDLLTEILKNIDALCSQMLLKEKARATQLLDRYDSSFRQMKQNMKIYILLRDYLLRHIAHKTHQSIEQAFNKETTLPLFQYLQQLYSEQHLVSALEKQDGLKILLGTVNFLGVGLVQASLNSNGIEASRLLLDCVPLDLSLLSGLEENSFHLVLDKHDAQRPSSSEIRDLPFAAKDSVNKIQYMLSLSNVCLESKVHALTQKSAYNVSPLAHAAAIGDVASYHVMRSWLEDKKNFRGFDHSCLELCLEQVYVIGLERRLSSDSCENTDEVRDYLSRELQVTKDFLASKSSDFFFTGYHLTSQIVNDFHYQISTQLPTDHSVREAIELVLREINHPTRIVRRENQQVRKPRSEMNLFGKMKDRIVPKMVTREVTLEDREPAYAAAQRSEIFDTMYFIHAIFEDVVKTTLRNTYEDIDVKDLSVFLVGQADPGFFEKILGAASERKFQAMIRDWILYWENTHQDLDSDFDDFY
jgi:hypothetical protein